jgi:tRNA threonylcarbamoyladenosine biosynthesis protein TsaE
MMKLISHSEKETQLIGRNLGKLLDKGDIVCLNGDLGTGKTVFVKGLAKAIGIDEYITSPTFTIVNEYDSEIPLYHFDVYRINSPDEMYEIGFEEYIDNKGIVVIEWADIISEIIPEENVHVLISKFDKNYDLREIEISFNGERFKEYEKKLDSKLKFQR